MDRGRETWNLGLIPQKNPSSRVWFRLPKMDCPVLECPGLDPEHHHESEVASPKLSILRKSMNYQLQLYCPSPFSG